MNVIDSFHGQHRFLSNFWPAWTFFEGVAYPTAEHAYQAAKTLDPIVRNHFVPDMPHYIGDDPGVAKRFGRVFTLRPDWERVKIDVMLACLRSKFTLDIALKHRLLATGDAHLVEGNSWGDTFWGMCNGRGLNHLGRLLMFVRVEIRRGEAHADHNGFFDGDLPF